MSNSYSNLTSTSAGFNAMLRGFGIVTVMNAKVFNYVDLVKELTGSEDGDLGDSKKKAKEILAKLHEMDNERFRLCTLKTLKVANVTQEGPTKTVTGGQYTNALIKFGKTATMEIQDALGNVDAIEALCGGVVEHFRTKAESTDNTDVLHIATDFGGPKTILGETFFIDQKTGKQVKVEIIFYQFLPDSIFNLTQDAEGDASVFDMNGTLGVTDIYVGDNDDSSYEDGVSHGVFYSILSPSLDDTESVVSYEYNETTGKVTLEDGYTGTLDGVAIVADTADTVAPNSAALLVVKDNQNAEVARIVLLGPVSE